MAPLFKTVYQILLGSLYPKGPETATKDPVFLTEVREHISAYDAGGYPSLSVVSCGREYSLNG